MSLSFLEISWVRLMGFSKSLVDRGAEHATRKPCCYMRLQTHPSFVNDLRERVNKTTFQFLVYVPLCQSLLHKAAETPTTNAAVIATPTRINRLLRTCNEQMNRFHPKAIFHRFTTKIQHIKERVMIHVSPFHGRQYVI